MHGFTEVLSHFLEDLSRAEGSGLREEPFIIFNSQPYEMKVSNNKFSFHYLGSDLESPHLGCFLKNYFEQIRNKFPQVEVFLSYQYRSYKNIFDISYTALEFEHYNSVENSHMT